LNQTLGEGLHDPRPPSGGSLPRPGGAAACARGAPAGGGGADVLHLVVLYGM
jgi:hypothetical protein